MGEDARGGRMMAALLQGRVLFCAICALLAVSTALALLSILA